MKGFPTTTDEPRGRMINKVREVISHIKEGDHTSVLVEVLGNPDEKKDGLASWIPALAQQQIKELRSIFFNADQPAADETWVYINPYRTSIRHCFAVKDSAIVMKWELRGDGTIKT